MTQHRMISSRIADSAKFLRMPASTRDLYFYLVLGADDDGVVEAFAIMRKIGAADDDLKLLVAKGFVIVLNDDLVTYITDWRENNKIRADRKVDSIYKSLLLQVVPTADVLSSKPRSDTGKKTGQPMDVQRTAQDKLRQDKLRQVKLSQEKTTQDKKEPSSVVSDPETGSNDLEPENQEPTEAITGDQEIISDDPAITEQETNTDNNTPNSSNMPLNDALERAYGQLFQTKLNDRIEANISEYANQLPTDVIIKSFTMAHDQNKGYQYAAGIMSNWLNRGLLTTAAIDQSEADFNRKKQSRYSRKTSKVRETLPDWVNNPTTTSTPLTPEQEAGINARLAKVVGK